MSISKIEVRLPLVNFLIGISASFVGSFIVGLLSFLFDRGAPLREPQEVDIATAAAIIFGSLFVLAGLVFILVKRERRQSRATQLKEKIVTAYLEALDGSRLNPRAGDGE